MAITYSFHRRLYFCLKYMQHKKGEIITKSGHTLVIPEGHEEPGFKAIRSGPSIETEDIVYQIGSDTAWSYLLEYAREMTQDEASDMVINCIDVKLPGKY